MILFCFKALSTNSFILTHTSVKLIIPSTYSDTAPFELTGVYLCTSVKLLGAKQPSFSVPPVGIIPDLPTHFTHIVRD